MLTVPRIDRFLSAARGQALREGTKFARQARVGHFDGTAASMGTVVRGLTDDYDVVLWTERGRIAHRCSCPSWRDPCKHEVAAALVLRQVLAAEAQAEPAQPRAADADSEAHLAEPPDPREIALEERRAAARREKLRVEIVEPPFVVVRSPSGFAYRVHLRGGADGPHGCDCPDFEANRLHACKHVERVRSWLHRRRSLPASHAREARRPRAYLHFAEVVEPRLFGRPTGDGGRAAKEAFGDDGLPRAGLAHDEAELAAWLRRLGNHVEPQALAWLEERAARRPVLPPFKHVRALLPRLPVRPYDYQWAGVEFLARTGRALLADEMGLGKTGQALLAAAALRKARTPVEHVTIVCPASLRGGWQDEIGRWLGEQAVLLDGSAAARARMIASRPTWLVTHYEQVLRDHARHRQHPPDLLVLDEAQRAKGLFARTARVLKSIPARHVFALTGTPLENRLEEAYAIAQLVDQRVLPPLWQLDRDHFVRQDRRVIAYKDLHALRSRLAPTFLRRRKEDVALQLPERLRSVALLPMHPAVQDTYDDVMDKVVRLVSKKVLLPADLDKLQKLLVIARRCCDGPHMLKFLAADRNIPKMAELEQALSDLCAAQGRKVVVFSEWTDMTNRVEALARRMRLPAFHLHGGVPVKGRPALLRRFTDHQGAAVFVSTDAGGVGLNLQVADAVVNMDLPWNPARLEQRLARVHRIGSKRPVQVLLLVTRDSVEERIFHLHDTKRAVLANVWAAEGEDMIAAPGGSGAFRAMVEALLATQAPPTRDAEPARGGKAAEDRDERPSRRTPLALQEAVLDGATVAVPHGAAVVPTGAAAGEAEADAAPAHPADALASDGMVIDPRALARMVGAVATTLPPDHRRSLATVFRSLADALAPPR